MPSQSPPPFLAVFCQNRRIMITLFCSILIGHALLSQQPALAQGPKGAKEVKGPAAPTAAAAKPPAPAGAKPAAPADQVNEKAMAAYADAANFQTNGAIPLAIEGWKRFLAEYPKEPLIPKASHYLGVCYMQQANPDYALAADAFARAVTDPNSDIREESLVNLGWCQFAAAGGGERRDVKRLEASLAAFETLIREKPMSKFLDRALFYGGEAAYALGKTEDAIKLYDQLLALESAKESPLRCEAVFARGIALEDAGRFDDAMQAYRAVIDGCQDPRLQADAKVRMGDASIVQKKFAEAIGYFEPIASAPGPQQAYALLRQAFALVQAERPAEASAIYERLIKEFPDSPHAGAAMLASAQATYRAGDLPEASKRFQRVMSLKDPASSTESAHWLAMIALRDGKPQEAAAVAKQQLDSGATGPYANTLKLDLAEATMLLPGKAAEAMQLFADLYRVAPQAPEAPRALYNTAFAALDLGQAGAALELGSEFLEKFPNDSLVPDVRYIVAEAELAAGDPAKSVEQYAKLLDDPASKQKPQWPLWVIRAATARSAAGQPEEGIRLIEAERGAFSPPQLAEALFVAGQIHLSQRRGPEAAKAFSDSLAADATWPFANEAYLQLGQAHVVAGNDELAAKTWEEMTQKLADNPWGDQARYRLALMKARQGDHPGAVAKFDELIKSAKEPALAPFALYGKGWNLMRGNQAEAALGPLEQILKEHPSHPIVGDARLTMGMCLRTLNRPEESKAQLEEFLKTAPVGVPRGNALYELALIEQSQKRPDLASKRLDEIVRTLPDYPESEKVIAELAWAYKDDGKNELAEAQFKELIARFPESDRLPEAHYFLGQQNYSREAWADAIAAFGAAAQPPKASPELKEKAIYRQGWSQYKAGQFEPSSSTFAELAKQFPEGQFLPDALLMVGEGQFKLSRFDAALAAYETARKRITEKDESEKTIGEAADRQIRELVFLHGGQSLSQLMKWESSVEWFNELGKRFPSSSYLSKARYETAYSLQQSGKEDEAMTVYAEVAEKERNDLGARARFMVGEILFGRKDFAKAIPEFQRVMFGYGAEQASAEVKNWQAKSGYEAGRCAELMMQGVKEADARKKSGEIAMQFYDFVVRKHPQHELAPKSKERLDALSQLGLKAPPQPAPTNPRSVRQ